MIDVNAFLYTGLKGMEFSNLYQFVQNIFTTCKAFIMENEVDGSQVHHIFHILSVSFLLSRESLNGN